MKSSKILLILLALSTAGCMQNSFCMQSTRQGQEEQTDENTQKPSVHNETDIPRNISIENVERRLDRIEALLTQINIEVDPTKIEEDKDFKDLLYDDD